MSHITEGMRRAMERYYPCHVGVHVCGADHEANEFYTVLNLPTDTVAEARLLFERAKAELAQPEDEPYDFVVDLNEGDEGHVTDFPITRQMLARLELLGKSGEAR